MVLYLVFNLTLKGVKELKHQRGMKCSESVLFDEEGNPDSFDYLTKCCTQESFVRSGLVTSTKMYLFYTPGPV